MLGWGKKAKKNPTCVGFWFRKKTNVIFDGKRVTSFRSDLIIQVRIPSSVGEYCCMEVDVTRGYYHMLEDSIICLDLSNSCWLLQLSSTFIFWLEFDKTGQNGGKSKLARTPSLGIYTLIFKAQQIFFFCIISLPCPFCAAGLIPPRTFFFLSLCKQITRIRENMISIFLCLYLHYGAACVGALMKLRQVES